jgi:hypothetical protein
LEKSLGNYTLSDIRLSITAAYFGRDCADYLAAAYEIVEQRSWVQLPPGPFLSVIELRH